MEEQASPRPEALNEALVAENEALVAAKKSAKASQIAAVAALVGACVAIPSAIYSGYQLFKIQESSNSAADSLKQARAAVEQARRFADASEMSAKATDRIATDTDLQVSHLGKIADESAEQVRVERAAAQSAANESAKIRDAMIEQRRPQMSMSASGYQYFSPSQNMLVNFDVTNHGSAIATDVLWQYNGQYTTNEYNGSRIENTQKFENCEDVYKKSKDNGTNITTSLVANMPLGLHLDKDQIEKIDNKKAVITVISRICYKGTNGKVYHSDYCDVLRSPNDRSKNGICSFGDAN